jgi:glycosyltransferase involved in cell wall biosynthesis
VRVLHVGWGFTPWRRGGLILYAEDLMAAQVARGDDVAYFFAGRHYPVVGGPRLKRWRTQDVSMYEVVNGPIVSGLELGTRSPELDLDEPWTEAAFRRVIGEVRPDVVHFQELLCLPSSLIDVAAELGVATVMTLQDYLPLCATIRLFDSDGRTCTRLEVGEDCHARSAAAPTTTTPFIEDTLWYEIFVLRRRLRLLDRRWDPRFSPEKLERLFEWARRHGKPVEQSARPASFQRRREANVERLGRVGRLVAQTPRVAEMYAERGVATDRMTTAHFTLAHIEHLRPRALERAPEPLTFATLGGCASVTKGSEVVLGALHRLREAGLEGSFRLLVLGGIAGDVRPELERYQGVELIELYDRSELDELLGGVDVGLMPSIWEEAYGYSGVEFIAKGIPLIANPIGGIVEYARDGQTAWLNTSCSAGELAGVMARLIARPEEVVDMNRRVLGARGDIVVGMAEHAAAIDREYAEAGAGTAARS